jgi:hypothetical protein
MSTSRDLTCTECGARILVLGTTRTYALVAHMVNAGEISVGEAREELDGPLPGDAAAFLAGWVLERRDQGDHWRAGDPETLRCGCRISYDRTQVDERCETRGCQLDRFLIPV